MNFGRSLLAFDASSRPIALLNEEKKMSQLPDIIREWVWILDFILLGLSGFGCFIFYFWIV